MATSKENFFVTLQDRLPQAKLIWESEPDFFFTQKPCVLTAISIADPSKKFTMNCPEGLGEEPLDDVIEKFIDDFFHVLNE